MFVSNNSRGMKIATIATITQTATINFSTNLFNNIVREKSQEVTESIMTLLKHNLLTDMILKTARVMYL